MKTILIVSIDSFKTLKKSILLYCRSKNKLNKVKMLKKPWQNFRTSRALVVTYVQKVYTGGKSDFQYCEKIFLKFSYYCPQ